MYATLVWLSDACWHKYVLNCDHRSPDGKGSDECGASDASLRPAAAAGNSVVDGKQNILPWHVIIF